MASKHLYKQVCMEDCEYIGSTTFSDVDEYLDFDFDSDVIVEDIAIKADDSSATDNRYSLQIIYSESGKTATIESGLYGNENYFLNSRTQSGKLWYRLTARDKVRIICTARPTADFPLTLVVLGRSV